MGTGESTSISAYSLTSRGGVIKVKGYALPESLENFETYHRMNFYSGSKIDLEVINSTSDGFYI